MRLPLAVSLTSRDGTLAKDPLVKNGLVEGNAKVSVVRSRPGVIDLGLISAGTARLLACWNGLLSVIGSSLSSLVITTNSGAGTYTTDTLDTSGDLVYIAGTIKVGSKFFVSFWDEDLAASSHYYGIHTGGFATSTALGADYAIYRGANSSSSVVAIAGNLTAGLNDNRLLRSSNSGTPTFTAVVTVPSFYAFDVKYLGGRFVALFVAVGGTSTAVYWSTDDGATWSNASIAGVELESIAYDGSYWWFYGGPTGQGNAAVYRTNDFATFSAVSLSGISAMITDAAYSGGVHRVRIAFGSTNYTSTDGATYTVDATHSFSGLWQDGSQAFGVKQVSGSTYALYELGATPTIQASFPLSTSYYGPRQVSGSGMSFCAPSGLADTDVLTITLAAAGETVTPTSIGTLVNALLSSEATGAAQSQQELLFKSSEQLWQYTQAGGLVLVTDIDYPGHHTYTASSVTCSGSTATFNTTVTNALEAGMSVVVAGATQTEYNGTHTIASIVDGDTFTYAVTGTPATPATGTITVYGGKTTVPGIVFLDGYFFVMTDKGVIHNSALGDGTSWNALDFVTAAEEPGAGVALGKSANYLVAFKEWNTEPFYDAGNATGSPVSPVKSMSTRVGCASGSSLVDVDDKLIWISQTKDKGRSVHVMQGLQQQTPVATSDVERVLELDDLANVSAYGLRIAGHVLYVLTLHTSAITLVYDLTSGVWYQWTSLTADTPLSVSSMTRSGTTITVVTSTAHGRSDGDPVLFAGADQSDYNGRFNVAVMDSTHLTFQVTSSQATTATGTITATTYTEGHFAFTKHVYCSGRHLLLHESNGHLYEFTDEVASDALAPIDLHCRTGKVDNGTNTPKRLALLDVIGHKTPNGLALVRWTDDDYTSWSTYRSVDLEQERSQLRRCGDFSRRAFELRYTGDAKVTLGALELDVKG